MTRESYSSVNPSRSIFRYLIACLIALAFVISSPKGNAQQITGTISGTAYDQSGAVVPHAIVTLKNESSGDIRTATTENDGHFVITAVQPATYTITIKAKGFSGFEENGIVMSQGDSKEIPNIKLNVGGNVNTVNVVAGGDAVVPTDNAEISTALNEQMIEDFPLQGRDAGELLKIVPGFALNNGANQGSGFNDKIVGSNNGPAGAYSSNGTQPYGTLAYLLDGANLVDPGNDGTQIANINPDMVGSIKILTANYGAEYAKGPAIFQALSRSGGSKFHGEGYFYTHNSVLNALDAYTASQPGAEAAKAAESYYYMGGNVGGPIIFPHFNYNKDHNKLFFWFGYEYMKQQPAGSIINYNVPNPAQLSGDFSNAGIPAGAISTWNQFYAPPSQNLPTGYNTTTNSFSPSQFDPNIGGVLKLYPTANETPTATNGYSNYTYTNTSPQNRWEATGKVDYSFNDNNKISGSYARQEESDLAPISVWWSAPWTLPYPSPAASKTTTYVILTNFTHVFSPTTTNEAVFTWSHFVNPYTLADPAKVSRTGNDFNVQGLFGKTTSQLPAFEGPWGGQLANLGSGYSFTTGTFGGIKQVPGFYDNFTKLIGEHTMKVGFYWDSQENTQNSADPDFGVYNFATYGTYSTGNLVADEELGRVQSYQQQNYAPVEAVKWHQWSIYAEDSFKAGRHLTINYGMRFDHIGQWYGTDFQIWNPATYVNDAATAPNNTGLQWHANTPSVPVSGFPSRLFFYAPRLGFAYDIFGTGKTVFRGGYGTYYYQASTEVTNAASGPLDSFEFSTGNVNDGFEGYSNIHLYTPPSSTAQNGSTVYAMQQGDNRVPFTSDWNATISQALPYRSVLEIAYVGNRSANEYEDGTNSNIYNLNNVHPGGFFQPDPINHQQHSPNAPACSGNISLYCQDNPTAYSSFSTHDYQPLQVYQNFFLLNHAPYSRYNGLQVSFQKQSGPVTFVTNYTFSKVLGIRDGGSNNGNGNGTGVDPFVLANNYGPLAYDHTHILNFTYNWRLPKPIHADNLGMKLAAGAVNGWQVSGYTAFQSGSPLQVNIGGNFNATYPTALTVPTVANPGLPDESITMPNGLHSVAINTSTWFGSNAYNVLIPATTCNPGANLKKGQRFNPACYTIPAYGTQGTYDGVYLREPNYWDSDLGLYKSFAVREGQRVEIRASATNWLNHPLHQFDLANNSDESLNFVSNTPATCAGCAGLTVQSASPTNTNTLTTGTPAFKTGSRFVTLAAKYYF
jgi:hypothetical protein